MNFLKTIKTYFLPHPNLDVEQEEPIVDVLGPIQERILTALLRISFVFGLITLLVGFHPTIQADLRIQYISGVVSVFIVGLLLYFSNITHHIRSIILMVTAYFFSMSTVFEGVNELTFVLLFSFVVMVSLLIGINGGMIAILIALFTMVGISLGLEQGVLSFRLDFFEMGNERLGLAFFLLYWLFFVGIYILTAFVYFDGFHFLLRREHKARLQMASERDLLIRTLERENMLISQLEASYFQANELSKLQSKMITAVAHEFRTPLTVIKSSSELLTEHLERLNDEKKARIQKRINESISSLNQILQDIENANLTSEKEIQVNLATAPSEDYRSLFEGFINNEFGPDVVQFVWDGVDQRKELTVDSHLIERILLPIISNALKFSPVNVDVTVIFKVEDRLTILVNDSGIGIHPEEINRIWEPFYRSENAQDYNGLGLGLSFVTLLVDILGGEITAVSPGENQGTEVKIVLPC